jgi:hypothetical protein
MDTLTQPSVTSDARQKINRLKFFRDELDIMRNKLSEVVNRKPSKEVLSMVDHFENQIMIHEKVIVDLKHKIKAKENNLEILLSINPLGSEKRTTENDFNIHESVINYERSFNELRISYIDFLSLNS